MRYMPKRRLKFDYQSGDGPLHLLFEGAPNVSKTRLNTWKVVFAPMLPLYYFGAEMLAGNPLDFLLPLMFIPSLYYMNDARKAKK